LHGELTSKYEINFIIFQKDITKKGVLQEKKLNMKFILKRFDRIEKVREHSIGIKQIPGG